VSYCATCDGPLFKDKVLAVVGGSDSAAKDALFLSEHASKVYIIYRRQEIRAEPINKQRVAKNPKIKIIPNTVVKEIKGKDFATEVVFQDGTEFPLDGIFIEIGTDPASELAKRIGVHTNDKGEIIINNASETNIPGFFAAGDVTQQTYKQAITGVAEGVIAAFSAYTFVNGHTF
jgi:thioredoxin reductase (NADPH)